MHWLDATRVTSPGGFRILVDATFFAPTDAAAETEEEHLCGGRVWPPWVREAVETTGEPRGALSPRPIFLIQNRSSVESHLRGHSMSVVLPRYVAGTCDRLGWEQDL